MSDFVHLHLHSEYSLLDGCCRVKDIPKAAKALGQTAVAITDHGVMYGAVEFYKACREEGIKPIIGCEVYLSNGSRLDRQRTTDYFNCHLTLLVENKTGYENLCFLVSKSFTEGFYAKPRIDLDLLREHAEGLICLSGCLAGHIAQAILHDDPQEAERFAKKLVSIFGRDHLYLEIQDHGLDDDRKVNAGIKELAKLMDLPLAATNDAHYIRRTDASTQAVLLCIQTNTQLDEGQRPFGFDTDEFYMKSEAEMRALFPDTPEAITNTAVIAERCNYDFEFGKLKLPAFPLENGEKPSKYLAKLAEKGLEDRIARGDIVFEDGRTRDDYQSRMLYELVVIDNMGYDEYFLIVRDFVTWAKNQKIAVGPGRGSGAGSLVAYLIGITDVDSLRYDLLFERFLNPERVSMPDFDIDFCYERRDEVIAYVTEKYGTDHVSQIITFGTLAARAVVRDVGRALGMAYGDVDAVAKLITQKPGANITIDDALAASADLRTMYEEDPKVAELLNTAKALEGMPRHASTHAAGVVIAKDPMYTYLPLAVSGETPVTQYDMNTVADLGLLKFDFLALRYLTILSDTEKQIKRSDPGFSIDKIPLDDAATYKLIADGYTNGVFQLESDGMRRLLMNMKPSKIGDIMAALALYRPGPMESIPEYLGNKNDPGKITYEIPQLEEILKDTYGCIIYQEQVMQICRKVAGFSYGKADVVRKAMAKKKAEQMEKERENFLNGAVRFGTDRELADRLFEKMASFAKYAFNKSHAAAYSVTSYRTAYMKAHYPAQYYAALLTSVIGNAPKTAEYISECTRMKIEVCPPDVNESGVGYTAREKRIVFGLCAVKSIGQNFVSQIIEERRAKPFVDFPDFVQRMSRRGLNKQQLCALAAVGAFDRLGTFRSRLLAVCDTVLEKFNGARSANLDGQTDLFSQFSEDDSMRVKIDYPDLPELSAREKLNLEKEFIGLYLSGNLLDDYSGHLSSLKCTEIKNVLAAFDPESDGFGAFSDKQRVSIAGIVSQITRKNTRSGDPMAFVTVFDRFGEMEILVFPELFAKNAHVLIKETAIGVSGTISVKNEDEEPKLLAQTITLLKPNDSYQPEQTPVRAEPDPTPVKRETRPVRDDVTFRIPKQIFVRVPDKASKAFRSAVLLAEIFCEGNTQIVFFDQSEGKYEYTNLAFQATPYSVSQLESFCGKENVVLRYPK